MYLNFLLKYIKDFLWFAENTHIFVACGNLFLAAYSNSWIIFIKVKPEIEGMSAISVHRF